MSGNNGGASTKKMKNRMVRHIMCDGRVLSSTSLFPTDLDPWSIRIHKQNAVLGLHSCSGYWD